MISVVIPTLNAAATLGECLAALVPAVVDGIVKEVIIVDGGSSDETAKVADIAGATFIVATPGRGSQLREGAAAARFPWLLFLHADTVLSPGWEREVAHFMDRTKSGRKAPSAAAFRFALDDDGLLPRLLEKLVAMRCTVLRLPYGDQGLLMSAALYRSLGGYKAIPLMEDVDLVRRIGWRRITLLRTQAVTGADRYRSAGYLQRSLRNLLCLSMFMLKFPPRVIKRIYG